MSSVIKKLARVDHSVLIEALNKTGDLGAATEEIFRERRLRKQASLIDKELTISDVAYGLESIAESMGEGARERKERILESLLGQADPEEAKYLVKILLGEMRTGFSEGLMELAISKAFGVDEEAVRRAFMLSGDLGEVAEKAKVYGLEGIKKTSFSFFRPIRPMLAQNAESLSEILEAHGGKTALEFKLDGMRVQIHKLGDEVRIFSRRLTEVTSSFPEVESIVKKGLQARKAVLEGEVIAVGEGGSPLPFQYLMRRFRRIREAESMSRAIPVKLFLFDLLLLDGDLLIDSPYIERRERLSEVCGEIPMVEQVITGDIDSAKRFFKKAIDQGHEGIIAKKLDSTYIPGVRGKNWLKLKEVLEPLDLVIIAAEYGHGRRHKWLSDYYLAARDEEGDLFYVVGKTFKGLTDKEMSELTENLEKLAVKREGRRIYVKPKIVVEVLYNEIQMSPKYECGLALRFARISRIRYDKDPRDSDTIQRVREIYERQFKKKSKYVGRNSRFRVL
ncbi:ATP-dependent DNA ligase [Candidatus Bathyarchaeota archaeon]|nr:ATP-dependent DNA ligase [Candidatus Bathyarchaeota archaeon]